MVILVVHIYTHLHVSLFLDSLLSSDELLNMQV